QSAPSWDSARLAAGPLSIHQPPGGPVTHRSCPGSGHPWPHTRGQSGRFAPLSSVGTRECMTTMQETRPRASDYPAPTRTKAGRGFTIAGFVCAVAAVFILPPILGVLAAIFGFVGY